MLVIQMRSLLTSDEGEYVRIKVNVECDTAVSEWLEAPQKTPNGDPGITRLHPSLRWRKLNREYVEV